MKPVGRPRRAESAPFQRVDHLPTVFAINAIVIDAVVIVVGAVVVVGAVLVVDTVFAIEADVVSRRQILKTDSSIGAEMRDANLHGRARRRRRRRRRIQVMMEIDVGEINGGNEFFDSLQSGATILAGGVADLGAGGSHFGDGESMLYEQLVLEPSYDLLNEY